MQIIDKKQPLFQAIEPSRPKPNEASKETGPSRPLGLATFYEDAHPTDISVFGVDEHLRPPDDDLQQTITDLLSRHPKGLSNEEVAVILKVPFIKVEVVRGDHG